MAIESAKPQEIIKKEPRTRSYVKTSIPAALRPVALALIARGGSTYDEMAYIMQHEYRVDTSAEELEALNRSEKTKIAYLRSQVKVAAKADAKKMLSKVNTILSNKLDRAIRDMEKKENLDALRAAGELEEDAYLQGSGYLEIMPINEVLKIAEYLQEKPEKNKVPQQHISPIANDADAQQANQEASAALVQAMANGDTLELQRILYTKET